MAIYTLRDVQPNYHIEPPAKFDKQYLPNSFTRNQQSMTRGFSTNNFALSVDLVGDLQQSGKVVNLSNARRVRTEIVSIQHIIIMRTSRNEQQLFTVLSSSSSSSPSSPSSSYCSPSFPPPLLLLFVVLLLFVPLTRLCLRLCPQLRYRQNSSHFCHEHHLLCPR